MAKTTRVPWKRPNPRKRAGKTTKHLSPAKKLAAKGRARRAGRRYPNLVDNMYEASHASGGRAKKTPAAKANKKADKPRPKKRGEKKAPTRAKKPRKNPRGGPPAAAPRAFARRDGSHLKPG